MINVALHTDLYGISTCSGYGGLDLAVRLGCRRLGLGYRTVLYCEREAYAAAILAAQMEAGNLDAAPVWSDLLTLPARRFARRVPADSTVLLHGGIPCQPHSLAGLRKRHEDERDLWDAFWRAARDVAEVRRCILLLENVRGFVCGDPSGLERALADLSEAGWDAEWGLFSAEECGAPHRRDRVFLVANPARQHERERGGWRRRVRQAGEGSAVAYTIDRGQQERWGKGSCAVRNEGNENIRPASEKSDMRSSQKLADAGNARREACERRGAFPDEETPACGSTAERGSAYWPAPPGPQHGWEPPRVVEYAAKSRCHNRESEPRGEVRDQGGRQEFERRSCVSKSSEAQPRLGRDADGPAGRLDERDAAVWADRLRALGNGVVPVTGAAAFVRLWERIHER